MRQLALICGAWMSFSVAAGESAMPEVNGLRLDSELAEAEKTGRYICRPTTAAIADAICHLKPGHVETIAGVDVQSVLFFYYDDRLSLIHVALDEAHYGTALAHLASLYGEPAYTREEDVPTRAGLIYGSVRSTWLIGRATLELARHSGRADRSALIYRLDDTVAKFQARRKGMEGVPNPP